MADPRRPTDASMNSMYHIKVTSGLGGLESFSRMSPLCARARTDQ
jgi:hypothetical protein